MSDPLVRSIRQHRNKIVNALKYPALSRGMDTVPTEYLPSFRRSVVLLTSLGQQRETADVQNAKNEVNGSQSFDANHHRAETGPDHAVTHADDTEKEEREGVAGGVQDSDYRTEHRAGTKCQPQKRGRDLWRAHAD